MKKWFVLILIFISGCSGIKSFTDTSKKNLNQTVKYEGPKARISVPAIFCKTKECDKNIAGSVKDLLINELVKSNRFIVLERGETLQYIKNEIFLSQSEFVDIKKAIPAGLLEGVDIVIVGFITAVEPEKVKFFVPVIIPWRSGGQQHITGGLLLFKKSYIQMIVRLIDVRTGRVLKSIRAEGEFTNWEVAAGEGAFKKGGILGGVHFHKRIPIEKAAIDLVKKVAGEIIKSIPLLYY